MKQSKKLLRKHIDFLSKKGISRERINTLRFYRETGNGEYIFVDGESLVTWDRACKALVRVER